MIKNFFNQSIIFNACWNAVELAIKPTVELRDTGIVSSERIAIRGLAS